MITADAEKTHEGYRHNSHGVGHESVDRHAEHCLSIIRNAGTQPGASGRCWSGAAPRADPGIICPSPRGSIGTNYRRTRSGGGLEGVSRPPPSQDSGRGRHEPRLLTGASYRALGMAHEARGEREETKRAYRQSLEILEDARPRPELGQALLAYGRFKRADAAEGRRPLERARALVAPIGATSGVAEADAALTTDRNVSP